MPTPAATVVQLTDAQLSDATNAAASGAAEAVLAQMNLRELGPEAAATISFAVNQKASCGSIEGIVKLPKKIVSAFSHEHRLPATREGHANVQEYRGQMPEHEVYAIQAMMEDKKYFKDGALIVPATEPVCWKYLIHSVFLRLSAAYYKPQDMTVAESVATLGLDPGVLQERIAAMGVSAKLKKKTGGGSTHESRDGAERGRRGEGSNAGKKTKKSCHKCNRRGHLARDCPN